MQSSILCILAYHSSDMYSCQGHDGQEIYIIPSKELVVVVLGYSPKPDDVIDFNTLLKDIINK